MREDAREAELKRQEYERYTLDEVYRNASDRMRQDMESRGDSPEKIAETLRAQEKVFERQKAVQAEEQRERLARQQRMLAQPPPGRDR